MKDNQINKDYNDYNDYNDYLVEMMKNIFLPYIDLQSPFFFIFDSNTLLRI